MVLNMTESKQVFRTERPVREALLSTYLDDPSRLGAGEIHLRANEGLVLDMFPEVSE
jgi:hypothetical protein